MTSISRNMLEDKGRLPDLTRGEGKDGYKRGSQTHKRKETSKEVPVCKRGAIVRGTWGCQSPRYGKQDSKNLARKRWQSNQLDKKVRHATEAGGAGDGEVDEVDIRRMEKMENPSVSRANKLH